MATMNHEFGERSPVVKKAAKPSTNKESAGYRTVKLMTMAGNPEKNCGCGVRPNSCPGSWSPC